MTNPIERPVAGIDHGLAQNHGSSTRFDRLEAVRAAGYLQEMLIGLAANPASSKDIRRLTGLARVIDIEEKANLIARLLVGIGAVPGVTVLALDDSAGLVRRAVRLGGEPAAPVEFLEYEAQGNEVDTRTAASLCRRRGAGAMVSVGGDGTARAVAEGWPEAPLVPVAAGTNNAFAITDEPTVIGLAAARAVERGSDCFTPTTAVEVDTTEGASVAVIDAVAVRDRWVGAGAIWDPASLVEGVVTTSRRTAIGISSISAALGPLEPGHARRIRFGGRHTVRAVFGPGAVLDVPVVDHTDLHMGTKVTLDPSAGLVALDGERRLPARSALLRVIPGPKVIDLERAIS